MKILKYYHILEMPKLYKRSKYNHGLGRYEEKYRLKRGYRVPYTRTGVDTRVTRRIAYNTVKSMAEKKYFDTDMDDGSVSSAGNILDISNVPNGNTDITRVGDKLRPLTINLRYQVVGATGDVTNIFRVILFQYLPTSVPAVTDILQQMSWDSFYNHDNGSNFRVLYDRTHALSTQASPNDYARVQVKLKNKKFAEKTINYVAGGTTGQNKLYLLYITDSGVAPSPDMYGSCRLIFIDT